VPFAYGPGASEKTLEVAAGVSGACVDAALLAADASMLPRTLKRLLMSALACADALEALAALDALDDARISDCGVADGGMMGAPVMVFRSTAG